MTPISANGKIPPVTLTPEMATALTIAAAARGPCDLSLIAAPARNMLVLHGLLADITAKGSKPRVYRITRRGDHVRRKWADSRPAD